MNKLLTFLKQWTLVVALCVGSLVYLLFSEIPVLEPIGDFMGPKLVALLPYVIFLILYVTFCKIQVKELRPRTWHFILQGIRVALSAICVALVAIAPSAGWKLIFEGMFICFICPTAAAAPVYLSAHARRWQWRAPPAARLARPRRWAFPSTR